MPLDEDEERVRDALAGSPLGVVGGLRLVGRGQRLVGVLPEALTGVPAPPAKVRLEPVGGQHPADHALGLGGRFGGLGVDVEPVAVASDDHSVAQSPRDVVVEVERAQALPEPVHCVVEARRLRHPLLADAAYLLLNLLGSAILAYLAWHESQWGFLLLEGVWALVSLWSLWRVSRGLPVAGGN